MDRSASDAAAVVVSPVGRWGGALTSRPLPTEELAIEDLRAEQRALLAEVWLARAASERRVSDAFVVVHDALRALRADESIVRLAERAVDDEMRHTELSRVMASRYARRELPHPSALPLTVPRHARASEQLRCLLHVVGHCCLNETIASAFLEGALLETTVPLARAALRELLSDEIDHARIGWVALASADVPTKRAVAEWLPEMAIANLRMWRSSPRLYAPDSVLAEHGAPREALTSDALLAAFRDVIEPGFARLDIDTSAIQHWLDRGAPV